MTAQSLWFDDAQFVSRLPMRLRLYAAFSRRAVDRSTGFVRGAAFLRRTEARLVTCLPHCDVVVPVEERGIITYVNTADGRLDAVMDEIHRLGDGDILSTYLRHGDSFIDIGANHGTFALRAARIVGERGAVLAIEPQPQLATLIQRSARDSGLTWLSVFEAAVAEEETPSTLYVPKGDSGSAGLFAGFSGRSPHSTVSVPGIPLDTLLGVQEFPGRVLVKLDVEGSECAVLRSGRQAIERLQPAILFELNPGALKAAGADPCDLAELLIEMGFTRCTSPDDLTAGRPTSAAIAAGAPDLVALRAG